MIDRSKFQVGARTIGDGRCFIVAEIAQAHDGSLGMAHSFIDAAARAGADAIKFQTHIASAESTLAEPFRIKFSPQDDTRYDYWQRMEFAEEHWAGLARHAAEVGIEFLSSPFSEEAVELLDRVGVPAWKIASGEVTNTPMMERIAATGRPVLLSTGMSGLAEVDALVSFAQGHELPLLLFQSTTAYPCPPEAIGLNVLQLYRERYRVPVGLSDHSGTIYSGLAAAALGADALEVHLAFSREMFGPDVPASVTTTELRQLVEGIRFIETMRANPVDKDTVATELQPMRRIFGRSVVARQDLEVGTVLERRHLAAKKPGTGIPADRLSSLVGQRVRRSVGRDSLLSEEDLE